MLALMFVVRLRDMIQDAGWRDDTSVGVGRHAAGYSVDVRVLLHRRRSEVVSGTLNPRWAASSLQSASVNY